MKVTESKTIFARFQDIKLNKMTDELGEPISNVEKVFNNLGMTIRKNGKEFKTFSSIVNELKSRWSDFSQLDQSAIAKALAGTV